MEDFEQKIEQFEKGYEKIKQERFKDFEELEVKFCDIINLGTELRNHLKSNPELCDENTYRVLNNQLHDTSLIEDKYKFLTHLLELKKMLLNHYQGYVEFLVKNKKFNQAIRIYEQMFAFTGNYFYKKEIANIHLMVFHNPQKCLEMYKEIEPHLSDKPYFWWEHSEVYKLLGDYFNQVLCMQKAVNLEMEKLNK